MKRFLKKFIGLCLVGFFIATLSGAAFSQEEVIPGEYYNLVDYEKLTGKEVSKFNEAPMLAELVKQGKLPPVEQRLPKNPLVVTPYEEIGQYGGTWRRTWKGLSDKWGLNKICHEHLVMFDKNGAKILPNIAESWKVSKDATTYTFKLREGIKWSDGVPLTTEDVMFWYEDILMNKELTPAIPTWLISGGKPVEVEKVDQYTFRVKFAAPNPLFLITLAKSGGETTFYAPKHYLTQFHPKYTPKEKVEAMAKEAGFQNWYQFFSAKGGDSSAWIQNPELPVLYPWRAITPHTATVMVLERNPYYWKVDPVGNQLPYIDKISITLVESDEMTAMKAISGEIDMQARGLGVSDFTLFMENRAKGDYRVLQWKQAWGAADALQLNQNVKDPVLRKIFEDRRFREALSVAINREEIWKLVYLGLGKPRQASLISGVAFYDPEWEKMWTEYDPKKANELLDKMGLNKRDRDGFRLRPDGKTLAITIDFPSGSTTVSDEALLIKKYLENIGVKVAVRPLERSLYTARCQSGDIEAGIFCFDMNVAIISDPGNLLGTTPEYAWAPLYARWYTSGGKSGEEPKGDIKRIYELWDKVKVTPDEKQRERLFKEIIDIHKRNIWMIGWVGELPQPVIVKNNFRNVPDGIIWDDTVRSPKNARPEQFFFKK